MTTADGRYGVAIVGLGIGLAHVFAFKEVRDRFAVVSVCDQNTDLAQQTADGLRGVTVDDFDAVLARDDVDVVSICTPPFLHREQCEAALAAGKHVIGEKPLVGSLADLDRLAEAAAAADRHLMPVYQYRYGHGVQRLRRLVDAGVAGRPTAASAEVHWRRRADYYSGWRGKAATELGGVIPSHALHTIDLLTHVLGPAQRVFARAATMVNDVETEDVAALSLAHESGALSTVSATLGSTPEVSRVRFAFARMTAESNHEPYEFPGDPWIYTGDTDADEAAMAAALDGFAPGREGWAGQFERFADALDGSGPLPVTLDDARHGLEIVTAAYRSARTGVDVQLPLDPDDPDRDGWELP